jgi:hypothetical protein
VNHQHELARINVGSDAAAAVAWLDSTRFAVGNIDHNIRIYTATVNQSPAIEINTDRPVRISPPHLTGSILPAAITNRSRSSTLRLEKLSAQRRHSPATSRPLLSQNRKFARSADEF